MILRFATLFFLLSLFYSCRTQKNTQKCVFKKKSNVEDSTINVQLVNSILNFSKRERESDSISILATKVIGNKLHINVSYSGGCKKHDFQLIGDSMISKSLPPIRSLKLIHLANDDKCKKLILEELVIDISKLAYKQEAGSEIFLQLEGVKKRFLYVFN